MSGYVQRLINVTFQLGTGTFGDSGFDTVTLSGLRVSVSISQAGAPMSSAQLRIYGMTFSQMNQLSTLGMLQVQTRRNVVTVQAGDAAAGLATVFTGTIQNAWFDAQAMPEVVFMVMAFTGQLANMKAVPPSSYRGSADVATVMQNLASAMGANFENNGVTSRLSNPYFPGTAYQQAVACADAAGINMHLDPASNTLAIWPSGSTRDGEAPLVSPTTGMIGYPTYTGNGIYVRTVYNPAIRFGGQVKLQSSLPQANGLWRVLNLSHELESAQPGGYWMSQFEGVPPSAAVTQ